MPSPEGPEAEHGVQACRTTRFSGGGEGTRMNMEKRARIQLSTKTGCVGESGSGGKLRSRRSSRASSRCVRPSAYSQPTLSTVKEPGVRKDPTSPRPTRTDASGIPGLDIVGMLVPGALTRGLAGSRVCQACTTLDGHSMDTGTRRGRRQHRAMWS